MSINSTILNSSVRTIPIFRLLIIWLSRKLLYPAFNLSEEFAKEELAMLVVDTRLFPRLQSERSLKKLHGNSFGVRVCVRSCVRCTRRPCLTVIEEFHKEEFQGNGICSGRFLYSDLARSCEEFLALVPRDRSISTMPSLFSLYFSLSLFRIA